MRKALLAFTIAALAAGAAAAQTSIVGSSRGHTYFNRAGATIEDHDAAVRVCHSLTQGLFYNRRTTTVQGGEAWFAVGHAAADAFGNVLAQRRSYAANVENCMVVHGWRVVRMGDAEGAALDAMAGAQLRVALTPLVGAAAPSGDVVRAFNNDMQSADTVWTGPPGDLDKVSLSIQAVGAGEDEAEREQAEPALPRQPRSAREPNSMNARAAGRLPADATVVVLRIDSNFRFATTVLRFERIGADPQQPAWVGDGLPSAFEASLASVGGGSEQTFIFQVPPGRWRIASLRQSSGLDRAIYETAFCLGAPSFEIASGEAVYAGAFHLRTAAFGPDLALGPMTEALANAPVLASRLQPARYVNGSTAPCVGMYAYAVEAPGAPFEPGYALGSRALLAQAEEGAEHAAAAPSEQR